MERRIRHTAADVILQHLRCDKEYAFLMPYALSLLWAILAGDFGSIFLWYSHDIVARLDLLPDEMPPDELQRGFALPVGSVLG